METYTRDDIIREFNSLRPKKKNQVLYSAVRIMFTGEEVIRPLQNTNGNNTKTYYEPKNEILMMALKNNVFKKMPPFLCIAIAMGYDYHNENEFIK